MVAVPVGQLIEEMPAALTVHLKHPNLKTAWIPTQHIMAGPTTVLNGNFLQARAYDLNLWLINDRLVTYKELRHNDEFKGTGAWSNHTAWLFEQWEECGDDGHVYHRLVGWRVDSLNSGRLSESMTQYNVDWRDQWWDVNRWEDRT